MFSKILIGVFAVAVMAGGGFAYYQHLNGSCCHDSTDLQATCPTQQISETPSCCQQPSRLTVSAEASCCSELTSEPSKQSTTEVLAIEPREIK